MLRVTLLAIVLAAPAMAQTETFLVKDKLTTMRLVTLTGDKVEEKVYDATGMATVRVINLDISELKEDLPVGGAPPKDGTRVEDLLVGRVSVTYRSGFAVARKLLERRRYSGREIAAVLESLVGAAAISVDPFAPPGGYSGHGLAYAFYGRMGVFIPWRLEEQALFGQPVSAGSSRPGDLLIIGASSRGVPDRVAISLGGGQAVVADPRKATVVKMALADLPGCILSARRVLSTTWEGYLAAAPSDLLALADKRDTAKKPDWTRIQGLASFYDHLGSEPLKAEDAVGPAIGFVPGGAPNPLRQSGPGHVYTLAHRTLPMGTRCRVTVLENGRSVECKVADRGNFESERSFEVCYEAAQLLGLDKLGVAVVEVGLLDSKRKPTTAATPTPAPRDRAAADPQPQADRAAQEVPAPAAVVPSAAVLPAAPSMPATRAEVTTAETAPSSAARPGAPSASRTPNTL